MATGPVRVVDRDPQLPGLPELFEDFHRGRRVLRNVRHTDVAEEHAGGKLELLESGELVSMGGTDVHGCYCRPRDA